MSADKFSLFHCLMDDGSWLLVEEGKTPFGWVRIYEEKICQGSPFGGESRQTELRQTNPAWTEEDADLHEKKFPRPNKEKRLAKLIGSLGLDS
jgi:hypothetical protein